MDSVRISTISVITESAEGLPRWLAHLENQRLPASAFEVCVVDLTPGQEAADIVERYAAGAPVRIRAVALPGAAPADGCNRAAEGAQGQWLLFLDQGLLASPGLLEQHCLAQEQHAGNAVIVGDIRAHPQLDAGALTRWFLEAPRKAQDPQRELPFWKWDAHNLSLPRTAFLEAGGFDQGFPGKTFEDIELAWRFEKRGFHGYYARNAISYIWRPVAFQQERRRQYARGYALLRLLQISRSREIRRSYNLHGHTLRYLMQSTMIPMYVRACTEGEEDIRVFGRIYRRVFRHDFLSGYHDAKKDRAFSPPA